MIANHAFMHEYRQARAAEVFTASPHKLIEMCLAGALERIAIAKGAIARGDGGERARRIAAAVAIIEHLRLSLDRNIRSELVQNLDAIYEYVIARLTQANAASDSAMLDESTALLGQIKSGWDDLASLEVRAVTTPLLGAAA
jgi:flagellar protein FliS